LKSDGTSAEEQVVFHTILLNYIENVASIIKNEDLTNYITDVMIII